MARVAAHGLRGSVMLLVCIVAAVSAAPLQTQEVRPAETAPTTRGISSGVALASLTSYLSLCVERGARRDSLQ